MKNKIIIVVSIVVVVLSVIVFFAVKHSGHQHAQDNSGISHYTCGMHPSVNVSVKEYEKGDTLCPICNMNLIPVYKEIESDETDMIDDSTMQTEKLKIPAEQVSRAGILTTKIQKRHLTNKILTVGRVAYDPDLAIAQDEFISSLNSYENLANTNLETAKESSLSLMNSSRKKLLLLGMSKNQIDKLAETKKVDKHLILPESEMWVYGDIYESDLSWIKEGQSVLVKATAYPNDTFYGKILAVNPTLNPKTRTMEFKAVVNNPDLKLKPQMYVDITINSMYMDKNGNHMVLALPENALLDTGVRKVVWIEKKVGEYESRIVKIAPLAISEERKFYPVLSGLEEGDNVVTKANFLLDSQSQITGGASASYSGALESDNEVQTTHQH